MKKLALAVVLFAAPAFACPNMEEKADKPAETAQPITAAKEKKAEPKKDAAPKAETPKKDPPKDTAKKDAPKKADKVSQR